MSQDKNINNGNFAKFVLNHTDKNYNHEQNVSNIGQEFATENDAQFIDNNNVNSTKKKSNLQ
jgi:hypothetical protein